MKHILRAVVLIVGPVALAIAFPWIFRAVASASPPTMSLDSPQLFIPQSFGQYGHYRGDNVGEWVRLPVQFSAGSGQCVACHTDKEQARSSGAHSSLSCETCHGPAGQHLELGLKSKPEVPAAGELCGLCHTSVLGRPQWFPQVDIALHAGENECTLCHRPHSPEVGR